MNKYCPSNGTEGAYFIEAWCVGCANEDWEEKNCPILTAAMVYDVDEDEYPAEWTYNEHGTPICTAFTVDPTEHPGRAMRMREQAGQMRLF